MSSSLADFWKRAEWDAVLQARLRSIRTDSTDGAIADLVRIGREFGFAFTEAEYRATLPKVGRVVQSQAPPPAPTLRDEQIESDRDSRPSEPSTCSSHTDADY